MRSFIPQWIRYFLEEQLQPWFEYIQCIWQIFLFKAYCYFKGTLTAIHLRGTVITSEGHLQWSSISWGYCVFLKQALIVIPFFKGIELIRNSSCNHPLDELPFFYYQRVIAATHSFKFTVFWQNKNCSKEIS